MKLRKLHRRSDNGEITTATYAAANPNTTTAETITKPFTAQHLNALGALSACANKHGLHEAIRRLND